MKNLIVTAAGLSTRFEGLKPKWMLTHPSGRWMIVEALSSVDFSVIDKVYFGFLQEHLDKYNCIDGIKLCFKELGIEDKAELVALNSPTDNQPHTVYEVVKQANVKGSILIKEVDNYFRFDVASQYFKDTTDNFMTYFDLNNTTSINPSNKSYVKFDTDENITDIVEKRVFSSTFGCGVNFDLRKNEPYSIYSKFDFDVPVGKGEMGTIGDTWDRYYVRVLEMRESAKIIRQACAELPGGDVHAALPKKIRPNAGEVYGRYESARGDVGFYIMSNGKNIPMRVKMRSPAFCNLSVLSEISEGWMISDVIAILGSLDIVLGEIDR